MDKKTKALIGMGAVALLVLAYLAAVDVSAKNNLIRTRLTTTTLPNIISSSIVSSSSRQSSSSSLAYTCGETYQMNCLNLTKEQCDGRFYTFDSAKQPRKCNRWYENKICLNSNVDGC